MDEEDDFLEKCVEGFTMFALNQGEVCTCPSRALIHEDIAEDFLKLAIERVKAIKIGNPLDTDTMMGAQASVEQMEKIKSYLEIGPAEGAETLIGGGVNKIDGWKTATTLSQPSSAAAMTCRSSAMRSSAQSWQWQRSRTMTKPSRSLTTPTSVSVAVSGLVVKTPHTVPAVTSRQDVFGLTTTTSTQHTPLSAAIKSLAWP